MFWTVSPKSKTNKTWRTGSNISSIWSARNATASGNETWKSWPSDSETLSLALPDKFPDLKYFFFQNCKNKNEFAKKFNKNLKR